MATPTATTTQVTLTINGQAVTVEKGTLLIEAAKQAGVDVPHFCYHPKLKPDANCRMSPGSLSLMAGKTPLG